MRITIHIRAVGDLLAPYLDDAGRPVPGRYAGRHRKTREALPEGETVIDHPDYQRHLRRGELALVAARIDVPLTIEPLPVIDLGSRLPIIDLGEPLPAIDPSTLTEEHDQ